MGLAETANLAVKLTLQGNFAQQLTASQRALGSFDARLDRTGTRAFRAGQQIGTGIKNGVRIGTVAIAALISQVGAGLGQLVQLEEITGQTNAAIASTAGVAGISAKEVRRLAEAYEDLNATMDDKVIQTGENLLLSFTNIRKEAFEPALLAALDLSVGLKKDLNSSILLVGKALNNPTKGLTALTRAGVLFTDQQIEQIKALQKSGDLLGAQEIILKELGTEFGGRFAAQGKSAKGTIAGIGDAVEDLQKSLATALFPTIQKLLPKVKELLGSKQFTEGAAALGQSIADLFSEENLKAGGDILREVFQTAKDAAPTIAAAAKITAEVVKSAVGLFRSLPPEIQKLAIGAFAINKLTGGLVTNIAGGLISSVLKQLVSGVVNVQGGVVNVVGAGIPGAGLPVAGGGKGKIGSVAGAIGKVFLVGAAIGVFAELKGVLDEQTAANRALADGLTAQTQKFTGGASLADLKTSLAGVNQQIIDLSSGTTFQSQAFIHNIDGVRDSVLANRNDIVAAIAREEGRLAAAAVHTADRNDASQRQSTSTIGAALALVREHIAAATRAAGQAAAFAIRDKDLSVTTNITVPVRVSVRETIKTQTTYKSYYRTQS